MDLTIDSTAVLTDFPALVKVSVSSGISDEDLTHIFTELGENSKKIKIEDSTSELYIEVQSWDSTAQEAFLWVKIPSIQIGSNSLTLYYDIDQPDNTTYVGDTGDTPATNVWDDNYVLVMHFAQDADGSAAQIKDSTPNAFHFDSLNHDGNELITGLIGNGLNFNGTD